MIGLIFMMSLAGTVFATEIFFDGPNPTEPHQVTKFFTIQYITSTVALSPQTVTETVNPTCTITATSIPVCGEASVGIIFTSGGMLPVRQDLTTTERVPITVEGQLTDGEETTTSWSVKADKNDMKDEETTTSGSEKEHNNDMKDEETTTSWSVKEDKNDMKDEETTTPWSVKEDKNDMKDEETTTPWSVKEDKNDMKDEETTTSWSVKEDKNDMEEEDDYSMTTAAPGSTLDLNENEIDESDYSEVGTTTIVYHDDIDSSSPNIDMILKQIEEAFSVTNIDNTDDSETFSVTNIDVTDDSEIMSIINEINLITQTSTVPLEHIQNAITSAAAQTNDNTIANIEESDTAYIQMATSVQENLPLSTSYEMATVVLPSCDCASNRQPRNEDMADMITFMTTKTVETPTVTVRGTAMHTIQYAGCLPVDAVVTTSCG